MKKIENQLKEANKVIKLMERAEKKEMLELQKKLKFIERKLKILEDKWQEYIYDYNKWLKTGEHNK